MKYLLRLPACIGLLAFPALAQPVTPPDTPTISTPTIAAPIPPAPPVAHAPQPQLPVTQAAQSQPAKDPFLDALASVYSNNPQLKAQRETLKATDETVNQAISGFRPDVEADYARGRRRTAASGEDWTYGKVDDKSLSVVQPVFQGGGTLASYAGAKDRVKAGRAQLTAIEQQVLFNAIVAYTDVVQNESVLEVNQNNVDVLQKQLEATDARFKVGELTKTDVAQSQARLASAQAAERQALGDLESSRATFKRVIGYDPPPAITLPGVPSILPQDIEQAQQWAEANEPTLQAARHLANAAENDVDVRISSLLPSVNLQGTMDRTSGTINGISREKSDALTLNFTIPLYQSGAEWSRVREAKHTAAEAKFSSFDTRDATLENVKRAWQDYNTAKAVITSNEEAVRAAEVALDGIRQENQFGTRTILDVLNTEQDLFTARVGLVKARVAEKQQAYRLLATVGRLTARDLKLAVDLEDPRQHYNDVKYKLIGF